MLRPLHEILRAGLDYYHPSWHTPCPGRMSRYLCLALEWAHKSGKITFGELALAQEAIHYRIQPYNTLRCFLEYKGITPTTENCLVFWSEWITQLESEK